MVIMIHERFIPLVGASNFRDLGGYQNLDGRETRWRRLFRSDALYALTAADLTTLHSLEVATVIDLRSSHEIAYTGHGLLGQSPIHVVETNATPTLDVSMIPPADDSAGLNEIYWRYLTGGAVNFVDALRVLSQVESYPAVMSCFFGKDRTGVLTALVLACLDMDPELIIEDYAQSARSMVNLCERLRTDPIYDETLDQTPSWRLAATPDTMVAFLERLTSEFGGAQSWALQAGVTATQLDSLRSIMLV